MIEFLIELLAGGLFEIFAEVFSYIGRSRRKDDETRTTEPTPWSPAVQQSRSALTLKLMLGAVGGAAWGYYVATSSDVDWPLTFWSFSAIGLVAFLFRLSLFSNEEATAGVENRILRGMVTFTPQRFSNWAALSLVTAGCIAVGFLIGS